MAASLASACGPRSGSSPDATGETLEELYGGPVRPDGLPANPSTLPTRFGIRVNEDGMPLDPALQPGPAGIPTALRELMVRVRARRADAPFGPKEPPRQWSVDPTQAPDGGFVLVPAADLLQGAQATDPAAPGYDRDAAPIEGPPRRDHVNEFFMHVHEADAGMVADCLALGACTLESGVPEDVREELVHPPRRMAPARNVTWGEADQVCAFLGGSLPTEAQWELAARGTDGRRWPWGSEPGCGGSASPDAARAGAGDPAAPPTASQASARCLQDRPPQTVRVPEGASPYGVQGMAGGVAEWTRGSGEGVSTPMVRGGGWLSVEPRELRATARVPLAASTRLPDVGFRCTWGREYVD